MTDQSQTNGNSSDPQPPNANINNDTTTNAENQQQPDPIVTTQNPQDVHTREKLFDFIALLQGRRMDDQRAILKPSSTTT